MASQSSDQVAWTSGSEAATPVLKPLYRTAGATALLTALIIPIQIIVFIVWPPPGTVVDFFALFQSNKFIGLLDLDLLYIVDNILLIPIFLALYLALRRSGEALMATGTALGLIGIASYLASNTGFSVLSLSDQYAAATTEAQRSILLAAGQAMLAIYQGTAYYVSYVLGSFAAIIISAVMLRSNIFSKLTAYLGIAANVLGLGLFLPAIGIFFGLISVVPFLWLWYILVGVRLMQLGKSPTSGFAI